MGGFRGQVSASTLMIISVVLVILIIIIGLMSGYFGNAQDPKILESKIYWNSASPVSVFEWDLKTELQNDNQAEEKNLTLKLKNSGASKITITKITIEQDKYTHAWFADGDFAGMNDDLQIVLYPGEETGVELISYKATANGDEVIPPAQTNRDYYEYDLSFTYELNMQEQQQVGRIPLVGKSAVDYKGSVGSSGCPTGTSQCPDTDNCCPTGYCMGGTSCCAPPKEECSGVCCESDEGCCGGVLCCPDSDSCCGDACCDTSAGEVCADAGTSTCEDCSYPDTICGPNSTGVITCCDDSLNEVCNSTTGNCFECTGDYNITCGTTCCHFTESCDSETYTCSSCDPPDYICPNNEQECCDGEVNSYCDPNDDETPCLETCDEQENYTICANGSIDWCCPPTQYCNTTLEQCIDCVAPNITCNQSCCEENYTCTWETSDCFCPPVRVIPTGGCCAEGTSWNELLGACEECPEETTPCGQYCCNISTENRTCDLSLEPINCTDCCSGSTYLCGDAYCCPYNMSCIGGECAQTTCTAGQIACGEGDVNCCDGAFELCNVTDSTCIPALLCDESSRCGGECCEMGQFCYNGTCVDDQPESALCSVSMVCDTPDICYGWNGTAFEEEDCCTDAPCANKTGTCCADPLEICIFSNASGAFSDCCNNITEGCNDSYGCCRKDDQVCNESLGIYCCNDNCEDGVCGGICDADDCCCQEVDLGYCNEDPDMGEVVYCCNQSVNNSECTIELDYPLDCWNNQCIPAGSCPPGTTNMSGYCCPDNNVMTISTEPDVQACCVFGDGEYGTIYDAAGGVDICCDTYPWEADEAEVGCGTPYVDIKCCPESSCDDEGNCCNITAGETPCNISSWSIDCCDPGVSCMGTSPNQICCNISENSVCDDGIDLVCCPGLESCADGDDTDEYNLTCCPDEDGPGGDTYTVCDDETCCLDSSSQCIGVNGVGATNELDTVCCDDTAGRCDELNDDGYCCSYGTSNCIDINGAETTTYCCDDSSDQVCEDQPGYCCDIGGDEEECVSETTVSNIELCCEKNDDICVGESECCDTDATYGNGNKWCTVVDADPPNEKCCDKNDVVCEGEPEACCDTTDGGGGEGTEQCVGGPNSEPEICCPNPSERCELDASTCCDEGGCVKALVPAQKYGEREGGMIEGCGTIESGNLTCDPDFMCEGGVQPNPNPEEVENTSCCPSGQWYYDAASNSCKCVPDGEVVVPDNGEDGGETTCPPDEYTDDNGECCVPSSIGPCNDTAQRGGMWFDSDGNGVMDESDGCYCCEGGRLGYNDTPMNTSVDCCPPSVHTDGNPGVSNATCCPQTMQCLKESDSEGKCCGDLKPGEEDSTYTCNEDPGGNPDKQFCCPEERVCMTPGSDPAEYECCEDPPTPCVWGECNPEYDNLCCFAFPEATAASCTGDDWDSDCEPTCCSTSVEVISTELTNFDQKCCDTVPLENQYDDGVGDYACTDSDGNIVCCDGECVLDSYEANGRASQLDSYGCCDEATDDYCDGLCCNSTQACTIQDSSGDPDAGCCNLSDASTFPDGSYARCCEPDENPTDGSGDCCTSSEQICSRDGWEWCCLSSHTCGSTRGSCNSGVFSCPDGWSNCGTYCCPIGTTCNGAGGCTFTCQDGQNKTI